MSGPSAPPPAYGSALPEQPATTNANYQQGPPPPVSHTNTGYISSTDGFKNQPEYPPTSDQPPAYPPAYSQYPPPSQYPNTQYPPVQGQYPTPTGSTYTTQYNQTGQQNVLASNHPTAARTTTSAEEEWEQNMSDFSEKAVRLGFIKKVFALLTVMLVVTFGIMSLFMFVEDIKDYANDHPWLYIGSVVVYMGTAIALICAGDMRRKFPHNLICLGIITLAMGVMLGCIAATFDVKEILIAVGITLLVTIAMMLLGFQQKFDFTWMVGILTVCCIGLIGFGIMAAIFQSEILYTFYASLGAVLFSLFIVVDVQLMLGGKHKCAISPEEYILAALNLYLDIINLFLFILMLVGKR